MNPVEMTDLVSTVRAFEQLGDAPVIQKAEIGKMGSAEVCQGADAHAQADAALAREVISQIRQTKGMDKANADQAERLFGELLSSGKPLSGREVAAVITTTIRSLQLECDPETAAQSLEEFAQTLQDIPLHYLKAEDFPPKLAAVSEQQIENFVKERIVENEPMAQVANAMQDFAPRATPNIDAARQDLVQFRQQLGGTPHFPDGNPTYATSIKKFCGVPLEACQAWFQKQIDNSRILKGFWKAVGRAFGLNDQPQTQFEKAALFIESMQLLSANRDRIAAAFRRSVGEGQTLMAEITRLACHPGSNGGAEGMIRNIDNSLELFETQYLNAKNKGQLQEFFSALDGVCFENRMTMLTEYALAHADLEPAGHVEVEAEAAGGSQLKREMVDHLPNDTMADALSKEIGAILFKNPDVEMTWEVISNHLKDYCGGMVRHAVDPEGNLVYDENNNPVIRAITADDIESLRTYLNDMLYFE